MSPETLDKHFIYTKTISGKVRNREISMQDAVSQLFDFSNKMASSEEHNPKRFPNDVFMLDIINKTVNSIHYQYEKTNLYDRVRFAKKQTKIAEQICTHLTFYIEGVY